MVQVKELKFRPNTDDHDYEFKKNHAMRFLKEGNRVKAVVQFRGREIAHSDLGKKLLVRFADGLTVETVLIPAVSGPGTHTTLDADAAAAEEDDDEQDAASAEPAHVRVTQCISTQVGCAMGCSDRKSVV